MKKLTFLFILLIFIFVPVFCPSSLVCLALDYTAIGESMDNALKLKEAGDIDGAIMISVF